MGSKPSEKRGRPQPVVTKSRTIAFVSALPGEGKTTVASTVAHILRRRRIPVGVLIPIALFGALKVFPKTPIGKHFMLGGPSFNPKEAQAVEKQLDELAGRVGDTLTPLHPTGIAMIHERRVDVVTRGEMIDKETRVQVIKVEGNRVVVEEFKGEMPNNA